MVLVYIKKIYVLARKVLNRNFIGIEKYKNIFEIAKNRIIN